VELAARVPAAVLAQAAEAQGLEEAAVQAAHGAMLPQGQLSSGHACGSRQDGRRGGRPFCCSRQTTEALSSPA